MTIVDESPPSPVSPPPLSSGSLEAPPARVSAVTAVAAKLGSAYLRMDRLPEPHHEKPVEVWGQTRAQWQARRAAHP